MRSHDVEIDSTHTIEARFNLTEETLRPAAMSYTCNTKAGPSLGFLTKSWESSESAVPSSVLAGDRRLKPSATERCSKRRGRFTFQHCRADGRIRDNVVSLATRTESIPYLGSGRDQARQKTNDRTLVRKINEDGGAVDHRNPRISASTLKHHAPGDQEENGRRSRGKITVHHLQARSRSRIRSNSHSSRLREASENKHSHGCKESVTYFQPSICLCRKASPVAGIPCRQKIVLSAGGVPGAASPTLCEHF